MVSVNLILHFQLKHFLARAPQCSFFFIFFHLAFVVPSTVTKATLLLLQRRVFDNERRKILGAFNGSLPEHLNALCTITARFLVEQAISKAKHQELGEEYGKFSFAQ